MLNSEGVRVRVEANRRQKGALSVQKWHPLDSNTAIVTSMAGFEVTTEDCDSGATNALRVRLPLPLEICQEKHILESQHTLYG